MPFARARVIQAYRHLRTVAAVIVGLAAALAAGCGTDKPILVSGHVEAALEGALERHDPPYFVAVYRGDPGDEAVDPVAEGDTDERGNFALHAKPDAADAQDLFLFAHSGGIENACVTVDLPALRRDDGAWVAVETGTRVMLSVTIRNVGSC